MGVGYGSILYYFSICGLFKGRSEIAFVLGLIFGPFGLLLVLVASRNEEAMVSDLSEKV